MKGHVRKRSNKWSIVVDIGRDEATGKRRQKSLENRFSEPKKKAKMHFSGIKVCKMFAISLKTQKDTGAQNHANPCHY